MTRRTSPQTLNLDGPAGTLECLLEHPSGPDLQAVAVVCHPHPLYGGTLHNKVAYTLAHTALDLGVAVLRFNFRGVGASEGTFGHGHGELEDLTAVELWLTRQYPDLPLWRMGFSFGAAMAIGRTTVEGCSLLVTVAPPVERFGDYEIGTMAEPLKCERWLLVQGDKDDVVSAKAVLDWSRTVLPSPEVLRFADAGHFFHGRLNQLRSALVDKLSGANAYAD